VAIYALFGPVVVCAEILGSILAFMAPLIVNLYCHKPALGYESYPCGDQSRNVWWVALLSFGEGWHNNHHALPQSARFGLHKGEFDFTWQTLSFLKVFGLVTDIRLPKTPKVEAEGRVPIEVS
jgi:stearoyl-CoA desaturase (delta-9 desaturase)